MLIPTLIKPLFFSFGEKPNQVTLQDTQSDYLQTFSLVKNEQDWQAILNETNPWLKNNLPQFGDYPYQPPKSYYDHKLTDFPITSGRHKKGFIDHKDQYWEWDRNEKHWDVQVYPYGTGDYFRVSEEGKLLDEDK
jgi:hypothetical protein